MSISAVVLVDVTGDHTKSAYKTITRMAGVKSVYAVTGDHDLIIIVETDTIETLGDLILSRIRSIDGVTKTMTSIVLNI
jgi:DNA-binding Lrp family transcriptional regulator